MGSEREQAAEPPMPMGWLESPHGAFRANPLVRVSMPPETLAWQIPLYFAPPKCEQGEPVAPQPSGLASDMRLAGSGRRFSVRDDGYWIDDDDFIFDAQLAITGDFSDEQRVRYAQWICDTLNAADALLPRTERDHGIGDE